MGFPAMQPFKHVLTQKLAIGSSSVASAAFQPQTFAIRVVCTSACHVHFGPSPTATTGDALIAPNTYGEQIGVVPGEQIAVIEDSAAGELYVTELSR